MNQRVCYETAKKLKDVGFPQPEFAEEQIWYDVNGDPFWIKCIELPHIHGEWVGDDHSGFISTPHEEEIFAPTAIDILKELNQKSFKSWFMLGFDSAGFECAEYSINGRINDMYHENPAEACAEMLLEYTTRIYKSQK